MQTWSAPTNLSLERPQPQSEDRMKQLGCAAQLAAVMHPQYSIRLSEK